MDEEKTRSSNFSKREWLMILAGLLMLEAWCLNASYAFQSDQAIINYVSFAATIASLLLAVIAIIYGYFQADGQQKSAAAVAHQIDTMRAVQRELNDASKGISNQLQGMTATAEELNRLSLALEGTHTTLGAIEGGLGGIAEQQRAVQVAISSIQIKAKETIDPKPQITNELAARVRAMFRAATYEGDLLGVALYGLGLHRGGEAEDWTTFINVHYAIPIQKLSKNSVSGVGNQLLRAAGALGIVYFHIGNDQFKITLSAETIKLIEPHAKQALLAEPTKDRAALIMATFKAPEAAKPAGTSS